MVLRRDIESDETAADVAGGYYVFFGVWVVVILGCEEGESIEDLGFLVGGDGVVFGEFRAAFGGLLGRSCGGGGLFALGRLHERVSKLFGSRNWELHTILVFVDLRKELGTVVLTCEVRT